MKVNEETAVPQNCPESKTGNKVTYFERFLMALFFFGQSWGGPNLPNRPKLSKWKRIVLVTYDVIYVIGFLVFSTFEIKGGFVKYSSHSTSKILLKFLL